MLIKELGLKLKKESIPNGSNHSAYERITIYPDKSYMPSGISASPNPIQSPIFRSRDFLEDSCQNYDSYLDLRIALGEMENASAKFEGVNFKDKFFLNYLKSSKKKNIFNSQKISELYKS